jgi:hypothetical protein
MGRKLESDGCSIDHYTRYLVGVRAVAAFERNRSPPAWELANFKALCEGHRDCEHKKTRELAREFLNDWEAIWIVL